MELIFVMTIVGILIAVAAPSFLNWRENSEYREAARDVVSILRDARNRTIVNNLQHRVEFDPVAPCKRFQLTRGDRAASSGTWATVIRPWTAVPSSVTLVNTDVNISFNPNGTANLAGAIASVKINTSAGATKYTVQIWNSGRIVII